MIADDFIPERKRGFHVIAPGRVEPAILNPLASGSRMACWSILRRRF